MPASVTGFIPPGYSSDATSPTIYECFVWIQAGNSHIDRASTQLWERLARERHLGGGLFGPSTPRLHSIA
jgi:hypothetical protein